MSSRFEAAFANIDELQTSEQFIPMFGLTALEHSQNPQTTLERFLFLIENFATHEHRPTTVISFGALAILVILRYFKSFFKNWTIIYRLPEVLLVVIVSTGKPVSVFENEQV